MTLEGAEFRRRADFWRTFAATIVDPVDKAALIEIAEKWLELADRFDRAKPPPSQQGDLRTLKTTHQRGSYASAHTG